MKQLIRVHYPGLQYAGWCSLIVSAASGVEVLTPRALDADVNFCLMVNISKAGRRQEEGGYHSCGNEYFNDNDNGGL